MAAIRVESRPSRIRYLVLALTTMVSVLLYLDRICLSFAERSVKEDLRITDAQMGLVLSSFFWTYALGQLPAGWLSDRYGARLTLALYLAVWSTFTGLLGFAYSLAILIALRLGCGLFEAGAYPAAASLIGKWMPFHRRGFASGIVSVGGRFGGAAAPVLTALFMDAFAGWRPVMLLYGIVGLFVACIFWWFFRDSPRQHPACNAAECALIEGDGKPFNPKAVREPLPFGCLLRSGGLWLCSIVQFLTNVGWIFLITWFPRYLDEVHKVPLVERGWMTSVPIFIGMAGMFWGGWLTDYMVSRLGLKWGRSAPLAISRFIVAGGFTACVFLDAPWLVTVALSVVALATDLGTPAIWAYSLDVGGAFGGSVLGWSNMFGQFGAAVSPILLNEIIGDTMNYDRMFLVCAAAFVLAGFLALFIDATQRVINDKVTG